MGRFRDHGCGPRAGIFPEAIIAMGMGRGWGRAFGGGWGGDEWGGGGSGWGRRGRKRMFDAGELAWPEDAPFHTPVFVLTHTGREPWERPGGTTFHFVDDGIESALKQARAVAGDRDVRIAGGAETIQQYLDGGLVDEFSITLAPVLFGTGIRLFDRLDPDRLVLDQAHADASSRVTHLTYTVGNRSSAQVAASLRRNESA